MPTSIDLPAGVTWRAVLVGAVLVAAISLISPWAILVVKGSQLTSNAIPIIAVLFIFLLVLVAVPVLKVLGRRISRGELVTVYVMMLVGSVVVTTGFTGSFLSVITGATYYATPENRWHDILPNVHPWLTPNDRDAVRTFYEGLPAEAGIPWAAWLTALAAWIPFILSFYLVIFCLGLFLRGQWVEKERLVFPLTRLPLEMLEDVERPGLLGRLFCSWLMWIGFAIPVVLHTWNSLANYHDLFQPWALTGSFSLLPGMGGVPFRLNLPVIGLGYLMPLSVSFSVWFFFLLGVLQQAIFARLGVTVGGADIWNSGSAPPALMHEQAGALFVLTLFVLWAARGHLRGLWRRAVRGLGAERELVAPRTAVVGFACGLGFMVVWLVWTGLSPLVAVLLVVGALIVFIGLSRIVCEAGLPGAQTPMVPQAFITRGFGAAALGTGNLTGLAYSTVWMGETAANMMNAVVHSLKFTSTQERQERRLPWAMLLAVLVGLTGSVWVTMTLAYTYGGVNLHEWYYVGAPRWPFTYMASVLASPERSFLPRLGFTAAGGTVMAVLLFLRQRYLWWPLHPIGFPVASTYTIISYDWLAILIAWILKGTTLRYGGIRVYRALLPFYLGLVLGEFFTACMWVFIDGANGVEGNMIFNF